jgi:hypothetical protein
MSKMRNACILVVAGLVLLMVHAGCQTDDESVEKQDVGAVVTTLTDSGVTITAQYLDRKMLFDRFGTKNNPFFEYKSEPVYILDVRMTTENPVRFRLSKVEYFYLDRTDRPLSRVEFSAYWESQLRNRPAPTGGRSDVYKNWSYKTVSENINDHVLTNVIDLEPGKEYGGYMLFKGKQNTHGSVEVWIPMYDMKGNKLHRFRLRFDV